MPDSVKARAASLWDTFDLQCRHTQSGNASMSYKDAAFRVFEIYNYTREDQQLMIWLSSILIGDCGGDDISWVYTKDCPSRMQCCGTQVILPNGYSELVDFVIQKYSLNDSIVLNTAVTGIYQQVDSRSDTTENLMKVVVQTSTA